MEELLLGLPEEKKNFVQMDYIKMNEIIEQIFSNEYNDNTLLIKTI